MIGREPVKISKLPEAPSRTGWKWQKALQDTYRKHPAYIKWMINVLTSLLIVIIVLYPRDHKYEKKFEDEGIATKTIRVFRDMDIEDKASTESKKKEAAESALAVYDLDTKAWTNTRARTQEFFSRFREMYPAPRGRGEREAEGIYVPPDFKQERSEQILKNLNISIAAAELKTLEKNYFSEEIEAAINSALEPVFKQPVAISKELLLKEKGRGIIAREVPGDGRILLKDLEKVLDLEDAKKMIETRLRESLGASSPGIFPAGLALGQQFLAPTLTFNKDETEKERNNAVAQVKPVFFKLKKGEIIVRKGDRVTEGQRTKIKAITEDQPSSGSLVLLFGLFIVTVFMLATTFNFASRNIRKFNYQYRDLFFLASVLILSLLSLKGFESLAGPLRETLTGLPEEVAFHYLVVLAASTMLVRLVLNSEIALVFALVLSVLAGLVAENSLHYAFYTLVGSFVAAGEVGQVKQRSSILRAGLILGVANIVIILALSIIENGFFDARIIIYNCAFGFLGGVFASILITGVVPVIETVFGYATDIKLLELLNQDQKLLKDLAIHAPGTHQHSILLANLAEAATEAVHANPLLARVMAMYHDIGKINKPAYFAENQWEAQNPHLKLKPTMSALIIINHVKEGAEMAQKHRLPKQVIDGIEQHHGTSMIRYFYDKAKETENPEMETVNPQEFRYPGPKPQTRETGILMLADVVESAARTLREPNQARIQGMVQKLINRVFTDGQLDDCELTLKDLNAIAKSFNKVLAAMYHHRPDYFEPVEKGAEAAKKNDADTDKKQVKSKNGKGQNSKDSEEYLKRLGM